MTRWTHTSLKDLIEETGVLLKPSGEGQFVGPHPHRHASQSGKCLVIFEVEGRWWCSSCKAKGDAVDWLVDVGQVGDVQFPTRRDAIAYLTEKYGPPPGQWQQPVPFPKFVGPGFPVQALPSAIRGFVEELTVALQVPPDLPAGLALAAVSGAVTGRAQVAVKAGWLEPLNLYLVIAMDSGEKKTPAMEAAVAPLEAMERELAEKAKPLIVEAQVEREIDQALLTKFKKEATNTKTSRDERKKLSERAVELAQALEETEVPGSPRLLCDDVTGEALGSLLASNEGVMALISDEGGIFETMAGRYSGGFASFDVYLKAYSGKTPLRVDRKGRPPEYVRKPRLVLCLCVQPDVISNLSGKPGFRGRGLLARPLYSLPESRVGYREINTPPLSEESRGNYSGIIKSLGGLAKEGEDAPHIISLSPEAETLFDEYRSELEPQLRPGGALREIRDWVLKLDGGVARLAGLLHVAQHTQDPWLAPITVETMQAAILLGRYFTEHAKAAFGLMGMDRNLTVAAALWDVIQRQTWGRFSRRDLHQVVKHRHPLEDVDYGLKALQDMGYIRPMVTDGPGKSGGRPLAPLYEVNPLAHEVSPIPADEEAVSFEGFEGFESRKETAFSEEGVDSLDPEPEGAERPEGQEIDEIYPDPTQTKESDEEDSNLKSPSQNPQNPQNSPVENPFEYITDVLRVREVVANLKTEPAIGLDIETTGLDPVLDKIRTVQVASPSGTYVIDAYQVPVEELTPLLSGGPAKVMHNGKFDAGFLLDSTAGVMVEPVFDTMIADQVLYNRSFGRNLKELAQDHLEIAMDKELQVSDWSDELSGAQIKYAAEDAGVLLPLFEKLTIEAEVKGLIRTLELENRALPTTVWMERSGVGFDEKRWDVLAKAAQTAKDELCTALTGILGESLNDREPPSTAMNWDSPSQVLTVFRSLGLDIGDTKQETMEAFRDRHPVIAPLLQYREAAKRAGAYGDNWRKHIHPATGRIHPNWKQIGAETGRMACRTPNLQNLPRDKAYRACFRPGPGNVFIKADYSQIELRLIAEISGEDNMIQAFREGQDLHVLVAQDITGKDNPEDITAGERQMAKPVNFGFSYGMGADRLVEYARSNFAVDLTLEEAKRIREGYFKRFPGLRRWHRLQGSQTETRTPLGRLRSFNGKRPFNQLLASPVQGSGADGLKLALAKLRETPGPEGAFPGLAIHDEIVIETPFDKVDEAKTWLEKAMVEGMQECLTKVPVVVDIKVIEAWE